MNSRSKGESTNRAQNPFYVHFGGRKKSLPDEVSPKESSDAQALSELKEQDPEIHEQVRWHD
jgi:hypothetical protein